MKQLVFSSSIQVMVTSDGTGATPEAIPYLPLDGDAPPAPGLNPYALSKHLAEELLRVTARIEPELCITALRYPMLVSASFERRLLAEGGRARRELLHLGEATAHLRFEDAAELIGAVLARPVPGYRQYFPAQTLHVTNLSVPELVQRVYPGVPRKRPLASIDDLVDAGRLERELDWRHDSERLKVQRRRTVSRPGVRLRFRLSPLVSRQSEVLAPTRSKGGMARIPELRGNLGGRCSAGS